MRSELLGDDLPEDADAGGSWNCASTTASCHGSATASNPKLDTRPCLRTAAGFYAVLAELHAQVDNKPSLPYFNPCSTDPTKSNFVCNTLADGATGVSAGPFGCRSGTLHAAGRPPTQTMIAQWVACGGAAQLET